MLWRQESHTFQYLQFSLFHNILIDCHILCLNWQSSSQSKFKKGKKPYKCEYDSQRVSEECQHVIKLCYTCKRHKMATGLF
ncbi:hypothetical protein AQUCO_04300065v1 [Aquilegia coerulea]|uniref:Uncharacterized protein n=1 Tax=Aquilegia coerulea TaxID=218851 RepID=A0A2G5CPW0_AQUCA|nr:hypothetical protein AQUCO_04300065v1 [Aquilegia coerulea]